MIRACSEKEILALAISSEEEDGRIYAIYAQALRHAYPASAAIFDGIAREEDDHRESLASTPAAHSERSSCRSAASMLRTSTPASPSGWS